VSTALELVIVAAMGAVMLGIGIWQFRSAD
jgi:uncharacterized membrane protein